MCNNKHVQFTGEGADIPVLSESFRLVPVWFSLLGSVVFRFYCSSGSVQFHSNLIFCSTLVLTRSCGFALTRPVPLGSVLKVFNLLYPGLSEGYDEGVISVD